MEYCIYILFIFYFKLILLSKMLGEREGEKKKNRLPTTILFLDCLKFVTPAHLLAVCCWSVGVLQELNSRR